MFNKIILVGNLTRDIEMKYSQAGMAIAKTAIATSRKFKSKSGEQKEEVCFIDITFFGKSADVANNYLRRGSKILVEGKLVFDQWSDQNGQKRSKHGVTVDVMQMLDSKTNKPQDEYVQNREQTASTYMPQHSTQPTQNPSYKESSNLNSKPIPDVNEVETIFFEEDEIPF